MGVRCADIFMLLLATRQEVAKKVNPDEPLGASLSVPRYMVGRGEKHGCLLCIARHFATTRGRRGMQKC